MPRDRAVLADMDRAARLALRFTADHDLDNFQSDPKTQAAVLHELLVLGEAAKRLSAAFRADHPKVPVRALAGMRDKLIHAYDAVDLHQVWRTVGRDLPACSKRSILCCRPSTPRELSRLVRRAGGRRAFVRALG